MRRWILALLTVAVAALCGAFIAWRHDRRFGSAFMNRFVNPVLVSGGLSGRGASEIGTLEHRGRRSGTRR